MSLTRKRSASAIFDKRLRRRPTLQRLSLYNYCGSVTPNMESAMQEFSVTPARRPRGFAAMSPEKKKEIAGMGGRAAHASGRAHQFTTEEARAAGKKRHQRPQDQS
jgi:general stress protein YciG